MKILGPEKLYRRMIILFACILFIAGFRNTGNRQPTRLPGLLKYQSPPLPAQFSFAGEEVPLNNAGIREQWDREVLYNYYLPNSILYIIKLSYRYFPQIEERLKMHGIPDDMKYLCVAESNLQHLVSKAGAAGFWQFMPATAQAFGLEVNAAVDERYHIEKSTDAACRYLKQAYNKLGSWTAAAASYNCGMNAYAAQAAFQNTKNYYDLLLPEETNRYIYRILTFKYFIEDADSLGFIIDEQDAYPVLKVRRAEVTQNIPDLSAFAKQNKVTYKTLKYLNPWLRGKSLPVAQGKKYTLLFPGESDQE